jgi:hypothetical protein
MLETSFRSFFGQASEQIFLKEQTEGVLQHLTHLEELVLTSKSQGLNIAIQFLKELYETLKGKTDSKTFVSVKFDGAPSIICGYNPENKKFFVSTKSLGNVTPKINYTEEDVDKNHGHAPGLAKKLKIALKFLPSVIKDGIYQGDFMFDKEDLKQQNVEGEDLILFKPNTITYAVPQHSPLGQRILTSNVGVVFHTKYHGKSLQTLTKSSDVNVSEFNQSQDVFIDDAKFKDVSGIATFTKEESNKISSLIDNSSTIGNKIKWEEIPDTLYLNLNTFINSLIRQGRFIQKPLEEYDNFVNWVNEKGQKAVNELKTEKGKQRKQQALEEFISTINSNKNNILNLLNLTKKLEQAKMLFINKYNSAIKTKQFLTQPDGTLKVAAPEGYVAVDHLGNMVKFVSRLDFSAANFAVSKGEKFK